MERSSNFISRFLYEPCQMSQTLLSDSHVRFSVFYHIVEKYEYVYMLSLDNDKTLHFKLHFRLSNICLVDIRTAHVFLTPYS